MSQMQPIRGTHDLFGEEILKHRHIIKSATEISSNYGFSEIKTPIFEFTHVFLRTLGDASDIVTKEMYTFTDKGGEQISLRPEGTASVIRALISEGLQQNLPLKFFYEGPMFRYERPQKGRYRQFYQLGIELLGVENISADIEVISIAEHLLKTLKVDSLAQLEINSIGDTESREKYKSALIEYYNTHLASLSEDSKKRLVLNPLRILDSKDKNDIGINANAPKMHEYFNSESNERFLQIQERLKDLNISFKINPHLVRGLDYYCHLVFEYRTNALGSQDAILSGGRYDKLSETMGGPKTAAVGWAAGVERLALLSPYTPTLKRPVSIIPLGSAAENLALKLAHSWRGKGLNIDLAYGGNMSNRMKKATKANAIAALIIGDNEISRGEFTLKILDSGTQISIKEADLFIELAKFFT